MDTNLPIPQNSEKPVYQTLGKKVFWLLFLQTSVVGFILFFASILLGIFSFQPAVTENINGNIGKYIGWAALLLCVISFVMILIAFLLSWLDYVNYTFLMAEDSFKIRRGFLSKTENAIPYRQIQNVDIERSLAFQLLGLSRLIILTAGHEDETPEEKDEAEGVIPAVDKTLAEWIQSELLKKSDVQKTIQVNGQ